MTPTQFQTIREKLALNQTELAEMLDTNQSSVCRYESGKRPIPGPVAKLMTLYSGKKKAIKFAD